MAAEDKLKDELIDFAHQLADAAGAAIMPHYRSGVATDNKGGDAAFDPVTVADRAAEAAMRQRIMSTYPAHGIIGEEFGRHQDDAEFVWVLDPIDGTKSFIMGLPLWGTLIGLLHADAPMIGISDHPFLKERFWGDCLKAQATSPLGKRNLSTRKPVALKDAVLCAGSSTILDAQLDQNWRALEPQVRILRYGGDCYDSNMLAEGHIDGILHRGLDIYDIAAFVPIVTGAGGIITGLDGSDAIHSSIIVMSGDPTMHPHLLAALTK